jgi:hypothetical protein
MATYVNDLRLKEIATGDESGTWGTSTNTNLELIAEAFSYGTEVITTNADTHTTTIADGATDPGRSLYLKYTGTLDSACTITIGPNTVSKVWIIENGTSGSQNIIISQGSGANITIPAGDTKVVYSDGAGAGAAFFDAFASLSVVDLKVQDDLTVTDDASIGGDATITGTLGVTGVFTGTTATLVGANTLTLRNDTGTDADEPKLIFDNDTFAGANHANIRTGNGGLQLILESPSTSTFQNRQRIFFNSGGADEITFDLSTDNGSSFTNYFKLDGGNAIFNETGADVDFRVESDTLTSALFVDGASGNVKMQGATTTIGAAIASTNVELLLSGVASKAQRIGFNEGATNRWLLGQGAASETSAFELYNAGGVITLSVDRTSNIATFQRGAVFNEGSADSDFRVESDAAVAKLCLVRTSLM